jgi:hypothetical protein
LPRGWPIGSQYRCRKSYWYWEIIKPALAFVSAGQMLLNDCRAMLRIQPVRRRARRHAVEELEMA